jgi:hypothetical protein
MSKDYLIQYIAVAAALIALLLKIRVMKRYVPLALFSIVYSNILCYIAQYLRIWYYPIKLVHYSDVSIIFNYIILPVIVMYWMRFCPVNTTYRFLWAVGWSIVLILSEYLLTRFTNILKYSSGYDIHISFLLWMASWFIFYKFYVWVTEDKYLQ